MGRIRCFSSDSYLAVLPDGHVFPMTKFPESAAAVRSKGLGSVIDPGTISDEDLLRVHTVEYIESIRFGNYNDITRRRLGLPWHPTINTRSRAATAGTLAAAYAACEDGLAANLAGGTHHAFADRGEGYCVFNDIAVAIRALRTHEPLLQCMVIDLDAHQGNGTHALFRGDCHTFTFSAHVGKNYPSIKEPGDVDIELPRWINGNDYLSIVMPAAAKAVERFEPDIVFYIAGVDVHKDDRFGQMKLTTTDIRTRDAEMIALTRSASIPTVITYGGGYNRVEGVTASLHVQTIEVAAARFLRERETSTLVR